MKRNSRLFGFFIFLVLPALVFSQRYSFKNYTIEDGLPQSYVQTISQDSSGYFWFGTSDGLARFDGKQFAVFKKNDGLVENEISASLVKNNGDILFGHHQGGMSILKQNTDFAFEKFSLPNKKIIKSRIHNLFCDKNNNLWISTLGDGVYLYTHDNKVVHYTDNSDSIGNSIFAVIEDDKQNIWIASEKGTYVLNEKRFVKLKLPDHSSYCLLLDKYDNVLVGTNCCGVFVFSPEQRKSVDWFLKKNLIYSSLSKETGLLHNTAFSMYQDKFDNIWVGLYNNGVSKIKISKEIPSSVVEIKNFTTENGIVNDIIYDITQDTEGNVCLGTLGGLTLIKPTDQKFEHYGLYGGVINSKQIFSIIKKDNILWVGTDLGLNRVEFKNNKIVQAKTYTTLVNGLKDDYMMSVCYDELLLGVWCGTRQGLAFLPENGTKFQVFDITDKTVSSITKDKKGNLWIGAWDGLYRYNPSTKEKKRYSTEDILKSNVVNKVLVDSKNNIWAATEGGLTKLSPDGKSITYNKLTGLKSDNIYCVTEDLQGDIWFGTQEAGIYKYDGAGFKNYNSSNGLASDNIYSIVADNENNIWVGISSGIDKFDHKKGLVTHYGKAEGFAGVETNLNAVYKDEEGCIWFGTVNGLMKYNPKYDLKNTVAPPVYITGAKIFLKDTLDLSKKEISYKQNHLTFSFIGLSFTVPEKVRYQYMLEGFDNDWSPITNKTEVTYSNIPNGDYIFKVKACNNDGVWNEIPATYSFTVTPPFWKTKWFISLCVVVALLSIYLYISIRTRKLEKAKLLLEQQVKERTAEVVQQKQEIEQKNKDITDSINYAKRIQFALLPVKQEIQKRFVDSFIFYRPRDIVSGDLYWFSQTKNKTLISVVDCTGHGVPGAFMSIVANSSLNEIVNEKGITEPDKVLVALDEKVMQTLKQSSDESETRDGMDVAFCTFDEQNKVLEYSGANRPLLLLRNGEITKIKGSNFPVGSYFDTTKIFAKHTLQLEKNDVVYIFSDGYADQFGGPKGKKFMIKKFEELLLEIQHLPMNKQEESLRNALSGWQGGLESVDDILVIGLKV